MVEATDIRVWEAAEIERSIVEAAQTPTARLAMDEPNLQRYLAPPAGTPYPLEYAFHLLGNVQGKVVLDYGCGNGENAVPLARRGARVIGLDVSQALLNLARTRMSLNGLDGCAEFVAASAHDVPLPDGSVDIVLGIAVLHHLDLQRAAREIKRLLRPGGRAIFKEPVRNSRALRVVRGLIPYKSDQVSPYERPLTNADLVEFTRDFKPGRSRMFSLPFINLAQVVPALRKHILQLYRLDGQILKYAPFLGQYAGIRVFEVAR